MKFSLNYGFAWIEKNVHVAFTFLLLFLGIVVYGIQYASPNQTQWDEVYYIPPVARYEQGIFFMESHPPLAKLVLTAGDLLFHTNTKVDTSTIVNYDNVDGGGEKAGTKDDLPPGYNFIGIRFFPVLAAILLPLVIAAIIRLATGREWLAFLGGVFVIMDTALALHFRSAMLDSILLLLMFLAVYSMARVLQSSLSGLKIRTVDLVLATVFTGLSLSTKYNSLVLLFPLLIIFFLSTYTSPIDLQTTWQKVDYWILRGAKTWARFLLSLLGIGLIFVSVWAVHFSIANRYDSNLENNMGFFRSSDQLKAILQKDGAIKTPSAMFYAIGSGINFTYAYHEGVPGFDQCEKEAVAKNEVCNGSEPWMWPLGGRSVNFRWSKFAQETGTINTKTLDDYNNLNADEKAKYEVKTAYYSIQSNPFSWFFALLALISSVGILVFGAVRWWLTKKIPASSWFWILGTVFLYSTYMALALVSSRILYLYHYFFPLILSFILVGLVLNYIKVEQSRYFQSILVIMTILVVFGFIFYAPFVYGLPLSQLEFQLRNWLPTWALLKV